MFVKIWLLLFCLTAVISQRDPPHRPDGPPHRPGGPDDPDHQRHGRNGEHKDGMGNRFRRNRKRCFTEEDFKFPDRVPLPLQALARMAMDGLPDVCVEVDFSFCTDDPELKLNITVDGEVVLNPIISDDGEYCLETEMGEAGCQPCVGIKDGTLKIKPNFAEVCPEYRLKCKFDAYETVIKPETNDRIPCMSFGDNCTATTKKSCLAQRGCGWCNGGGRGREFADDKSPEGTGCTPMVPKGRPPPGERPEFRPFCANCPSENFIDQEDTKSAAAGEYIEAHPGQIVGITLGSAVFILAVVGCFVFSIRAKNKRPNTNDYDGSLADNDSLANQVELQQTYDDQ